MSWLKGLTDIRLLGSISGNLKVQRELLNEVGIFYPLVLDYHKAADDMVRSISGASLSEYIGTGNAAYFNDMMAEFAWSSYLMGMDWSIDDELVNIKSDLELMLTISTLQVTTKNEFTDKIDVRNNFVFLLTFPTKHANESDLMVSTAGFFSPAQDIIVSIGNEKFKQTLFHEGVHAITRSAKELLNDMMYGDTDEVKLEEIMTHTLTDKFGSFANFNSAIEGMSYQRRSNDSGWTLPANLEFKPKMNGHNTLIKSVHVGNIYSSNSKGMTPATKRRVLLVKECRKKDFVKGKSGRDDRSKYKTRLAGLFSERKS